MQQLQLSFCAGCLLPKILLISDLSSIDAALSALTLDQHIGVRDTSWVVQVPVIFWPVVCVVSNAGERPQGDVCVLIIEALAPLEPEIRPMFSGFAVYVGEKIVLMLRDSPKQPEDNGVWLVFSEIANLDDPRIHQDFPSLRIINRLGGKIDHCRLIPADSPTFESEALHACELLLKPDRRFGRIPQSRKAHSSRPRRN